MDTIPLQLVLGRLEACGCRPRKNGEGFKATCPAHEDRTPSLSIKQGQKGVVLHCFAGCALEDVLGAVGLKVSDLFDREHDRDITPTPAAWVHPGRNDLVHQHTWQYHDDAGTLVGEVRKFHQISPGGVVLGKTFRQYRFEGGRPVAGLNGHRMPLYRLPAIRRAIAAGKLVYITEGEKDADTCLTLGQEATCNAMGAGKWQEYHTTSLIGLRAAVVVADNDEPGLKHARAVAHSLRAAGIPVEVRTPPEGHKDLTDMAEAGLGLRDLRPLAEEEEPDDDGLPHLDLAAIWDTEAGEEYHLEPLIPIGRGIALYSPPKTGKSLLMLELAAAVATGGQALGQTARAAPVLYIDFENTPTGDIVPRLKAMGHSHDRLGNLKILSFPSLPALDTPQGGEALLEHCIKHEIQLVVIDTISRAVEGEENSNDTWLKFYRRTGSALKRAGITVIRLDHAGKDETKGQRGGSAKSGDVDAVWRLTDLGDDCYELECEASRFPLETTRLVLRRQQGPLRHILEGRTREDVEVARVLRELRETGCPDHVTFRSLREHLDEHHIKYSSRYEKRVREEWNASLKPF